jgi:hypothetical protein
MMLWKRHPSNIFRAICIIVIAAYNNIEAILWDNDHSKSENLFKGEKI